MSNDEKMCPLTKMTCYGKECAWWNVRNELCSVRLLAVEAYNIDRTLHILGGTLEERL